ncbi:MAG: hypothetical protein JEZ12_21370 [Desulfobacterium sp.]|nr:hypothetical protein [Desulfobacterium sp.]
MPKFSVSSIVFLLLCSLCLLSPHVSHGQLEILTDAELKAVTGMGGVNFSVIGGTTAVFNFDLHLELYGEIDSVKMGYYYKEDLTTRKFLPIYSDIAKRDPQVVYKDDTFDIIDLDTGDVIYADRPYFLYHGKKFPYTDDDYYMYKYKNMLGQYYVDGKQGLNDKDMLGEAFSTARTKNTNNLDWDLNIENLRIGKSPTDPLVIDGLTVMLKYDDINSPHKKLTDIIIGTNSMEGHFSGDLIRTTGCLNAKLTNKTRNTNAIFNSIFIPEFNETPVPVVLQRDSFLMLVDEYHAQYDDPTDGDTPPHPEDPTNNNIHTGAFLRVGLDPTSPTYGYSVIAGYNEVVAAAYEPRHAMLKDSIKDWWHK